VRVLRFSASRNSVWVQVIHDEVKHMKVYVRRMDGEERACVAEVTPDNAFLRCSEMREGRKWGVSLSAAGV